MNTPTWTISHRRHARVGVTRLAAALGLATFLTAPLAAHARVTTCKDCIEGGNDTTSTPGKTASSRDDAGQAQNPAIGFVGRDHLLHCAVPASPGWSIETVDPAAMAGGCSMALDDVGEPMIAYHDANGMLLLAHRVNGGWIVEPVDPSGGATGGTSIARIPGGVCIAWVATAVGALRYAERVGSGAWSIESVTSSGSGAAYPSLVVDGGMPAISYYDPAAGDLRLALRTPGNGWTTTLVDGDGDVGGYSSLVVGSTSGSYGIAYYDFTNADLKYAHPGPGGWTIDTVDGAGASVGRFCAAVALAGTPDDLVGVAYYDETHGDLKYALKRGPGWTVTVQDTAGDVGGSIVAGGTPTPADTFGIVYTDRTTGDVLYQSHAGTVESVPVTLEPRSPLGVQWLRAAGGGSGRVRFTMPAAGRARVSVYDAAGRVIAVPLSETLPAGAAEVGWDGRDTRGRRVGAGVLFVRVDTAGAEGAIPAVLLR